jgi:hypothetical protein
MLLRATCGSGQHLDRRRQVPPSQSAGTANAGKGWTPQYARARPRWEKTITTIGHLGEARDRLTVADAHLENCYDERYDSEPDPDGHAVCMREAEVNAQVKVATSQAASTTSR